MTFLEQLLGIKPKQEDKPTDAPTTAPEQTQLNEIEKQIENQPEQAKQLEQPTPTAPVEVKQTTTAPKILPAYPIYPNMPIDIKEISDVPQFEMTFQEAQKAGFQFRFTKSRGHTPTVIITGIFVSGIQVIIPAKINGYEVKRIGERCKVRVRKGLPKVTLCLPNTLKFIDEYAFSHFRKLTTVFFPEGDIVICENAFLYNKDLKELHFGRSTVIGEKAFLWDSNLKELHFGEYTDIGKEAFRYCEGLESVELNECSLRKSAFDGCENLKTVKWSKISYYEDNIFYNTPFEKSQEILITDDIFQKYNGNEKTVIVPDGVKKIGQDAFKYCRTLEKVVLPSSVKTIGHGAFSWCENLREINLENVLHIDAYSFCNCRSLGGDIKFNPLVEFKGEPFFNSLFGEEHTTPDGIVVNNTLTSLDKNFVDDVWTISEGIRRISVDYDRGGCWEKTIIFPKSMERVENLECFDGAERVVIRNGDMWIGKGYNLASWCDDFTLCFETDEGVSEFVFYKPKWRKDNPTYNAVMNLYKTFFSGMRFHYAISHYDKEILTVGLSYRQTLDIAYKRLIGGFELNDNNRKRYMDFVRTHRKKGLRYATAEKNEQKIEFFKALFA